MSRIPRLLPLIAVAIVGVLAVNFLAGARDLPSLVSSAKAFAEGALPKENAKPAKDKDAEETPEAEHAASPLPTEGAAITASDLAANADALCSPAEMKFLSDLQARRGQLDLREGDIDTQLKLIEAAEAKLAVKIAELNGLKTDINGLLGQVDAKQAAETARLVKVYSNMKPQNAAAAMATLTDEVRLPIAANMKEANLSAVLNKMTAPQAKDITEKLAQRFAAATSVTQARAATAPPAATPATPAQAAAKPVAAPTTPSAPGAQAAAEPEKPAAAPVRKKPKRQAARKPRPKPAAAAPDPKDAAYTPPATG